MWNVLYNILMKCFEFDKEFITITYSWYIFIGSTKIPPEKIPTRKISIHQTSPWKTPPGKFPPGIIPPISLIVFIHIFFT